MKKRFLIAGTVLLGIFLSLLFLETRGILSRFDGLTTVWLQTLIPQSLNVVLSLFTLLGSFELTALAVLALAIYLFRRQNLIPFSLALFLMILVFEFLGKLFLYHPGPPPQFFRFSLPFNLPSAYVQTSYSFPSGHVSRTLFVVTIAFFLFRRRLARAALILLAMLMIISRVYLGEHWASDVIGGVLLGASMGLYALAYVQ